MRTTASIILLLCAATPLAVAQTAPDAQAPAPADSMPKPALVRAKDTLSVDFPDEEIRTVLRNVADLFELNLVIPDTLQGKTSVKLRDVTWRQIFKVVLEPVGYTFVEDSNIIKVVTQDSLNLEPLSTEVFVLNYARAADIKPSLDALVDIKLGGKIVVDARSNALVVTERPSAVQRIRPIVLNLDKATEQVMIETKFIEVTDRDVKNTGVNWASLSGYGLNVNNIGRSYNNTRTSTHTANNIDVPYMQDGYEKLDTLLNRNLGTPLNDPAHGVGPAYAYDPNTGVTTIDGDKFGPKSQVQSVLTGVTSAVFSADQFSLVVSALKTFNDTKLVSNPTVVTLNNTEATINVGEEYPIPQYTYNQERGSFEVSGFTYKPIGVILKVTPQVNSAGFIKLAVEPTVSSRNGTVDFGGAGGAQIPIIGIRTAKTQVTMKDGYTLGLGGLSETTDIAAKSSVPLLGSIPGIGKLFSSDGKDTTLHNLVVFITARTLRPDGASTGEVFDPRMVREMKITKEELPGFRDGSDPFYKAPVEAAPKK
ncbi:MAG TPA: secretin N-terminal domain-containing protein [Opitutaceae bacterium]